MSREEEIHIEWGRRYAQLLNELQAVRVAFERALSEVTRASDWPRGTKIKVEHDGFEGVILGPYVTLEGKRGQVCQLKGAQVVHVYGEKWLKKVAP